MSETNEKQKCPLCGYEFIPGAEVCQSVCPLQGKCGGCAQISCPKCGYKMAGESKIVNWIKGLFSGKNLISTTLLT